MMEFTNQLKMMTRIDAKKFTVAELVGQFTAIALEQDRAIFDDKTARYNRLYRQMTAILLELKSRPGDQRRALVPLLEHPNVQVRLKAGIATLTLAPDEARFALQSIWDHKEFPQAAYEKGILKSMDEGRYVPS